MLRIQEPLSRAARLRRHTVALARAARDVLESEFDGCVKAFSVLAPYATNALGLIQASLWQADDEGLVCRAIVRYPNDSDKIAIIPIDEEAQAGVRRQAVSERVARVSNSAGVGDALWFDFLATCGSGAHLDARINVAGAYWGQVCFHAARPRRWHADEAALAGYFADVLGVAVEREHRREAQAQLQYLQLYDQTSGLANRTLFHACLARSLRQARLRSRRAVVLFVDMDRFYTVNEVLGEQGGNSLLADLADRISQVTPNEALLARVESDCFGVLLPHVEYEWLATQYADAILQAVATPIQRDGQSIEISASVGIAFASATGPMTAEEWLRNADLASKEAKASGRNCSQIFDPVQYSSLVERLAIERGLRQALHDQRIEVAFQAEFDLKTMTVVGAEALARWRQTDGTLTAAGEFIDVAEASGLIDVIGGRVLQVACAEACTWPACLDGSPRSVRVNMSARQFAQAHLVDQVREALEASGLEPSRLCLEITETTVMSRAEAALSTLEGLRSLGVRLAIDDFGTGYSSLAYLRRFPVDTLKLDKALLDTIPGDAAAEAVLTAIAGLANALNLEVVVEGIEREEQEPFLRSLGLHLVQGFHYARPEPAADFAKRIRSSGQGLVQ